MNNEEFNKKVQEHREYMKERMREHYNLARDLGLDSYEASTIMGRSKSAISDIARQLNRRPGRKYKRDGKYTRKTEG